MQDAFSIIYSYDLKNYYMIFHGRNNNCSIIFSYNGTIESKEPIIKNITNDKENENLNTNSPDIISTILKIPSSTFLESTIVSTIPITSSSSFSTLLPKQSNIPTILSFSFPSLFA